MNFFLPLKEETPTPTPLSEIALFCAMRSGSLSVRISCKTFGISIIGGRFRFREEEAVGLAVAAVGEEFEHETEGSVVVTIFGVIQRRSETPTAIQCQSK